MEQSSAIILIFILNIATKKIMLCPASRKIFQKPQVT